MSLILQLIEEYGGDDTLDLLEEYRTLSGKTQPQNGLKWLHKLKEEPREKSPCSHSFILRDEIGKPGRCLGCGKLV